MAACIRVIIARACVHACMHACMHVHDIYCHDLSQAVCRQSSPARGVDGSRMNSCSDFGLDCQSCLHFVAIQSGLIFEWAQRFLDLLCLHRVVVSRALS